MQTSENGFLECFSRLDDEHVDYEFRRKHRSGESRRETIIDFYFSDRTGTAMKGI